MKISLGQFFQTALLGAALSATVATTPVLRAQEHKMTYHDKERNEDHEWNEREDKAYRMWVKEQHRKTVDFQKLKEQDRQKYWHWRHDHDDTVLKLDIH